MDCTSALKMLSTSVISRYKYFTVPSNQSVYRNAYLTVA